MIRWQDALGNRHEFDGWRGYLDDSAGAEETWWVASMNFDTGPFHWLVYSEAGGELLGASDDFDLVSRMGEVVAVDLLLP